MCDELGNGDGGRHTLTDYAGIEGTSNYTQKTVQFVARHFVLCVVTLMVINYILCGQEGRMNETNIHVNLSACAQHKIGPLVVSFAWRPVHNVRAT